jgi:hypothetical protein
MTASNWQNNSIPPAILPSGSQIVIDPIINGECLLNIQQTISSGASMRVKTSKKLRVTGNLVWQ